jgi:hypothetical protein
MAKRSTKRNTQSALAGLAALGAYVAGKNMYRRPGEELAPVEDFSKYVSRNDPTAFEGVGVNEVGMGDRAPADAGTVHNEVGGVGRSEVAAAAPRVDPTVFEGYGVNEVGRGTRTSAGPAVRPAVRPAAASTGPALISNQSAGSPQTDLRGYDDMYANRPPAFNRQIGMGEPGYTKEDMDAFRKRVLDQGQMATISNYKTRAGTRAGGPPVFTSGRRMDIAPSREEAIAQIPMGGVKAPEGGSRISSSETERNLANIAAGLGPTRLAGFANAGIEAAFLNAQRNAAAARNASAAQNAAAARRAQLAEEARRGQTPTNFTSTTSRSANKRTKKIDEDNTGVEFKRGGKTKKMASGGMTSASKRGDGIASKGKTKCKMY